MVKHSTKFQRNGKVHRGVIAILMFDLMTLSICHVLRLGSEIIFTKFEVGYSVNVSVPEL